MVLGLCSKGKKKHGKVPRGSPEHRFHEELGSCVQQVECKEKQFSHVKFVDDVLSSEGLAKKLAKSVVNSGNRNPKRTAEQAGQSTFK